MPRHRVPLRERSEASSFLVRTASAASIANRNSSKRRWSTADVPPLDVTSREVGDDSDAIAATPVTSAGVFVTPNVVLAALSTSEWLMCSGDRHDSLSTLQSSGAPFPCVVITAEVGGWLRVREQRNGAIRYQRRLRSLSDPSCLCWGSPSLCGGSINGGPIFFAGQQCGLVTVLQLRGETIVEVADCVLHEVPIVALTRVFVRDGASHIVSAGVAEEQNEEVLATLDAGGLLAVWDTAALHCLSTAQLRQTPARCLLSDGCVPGCVFVPGGVSTAPPPPRGDDSHCHSIDDNLSSRSGQDGAFDIVLTRCPVGAGAPWKAVVAYSGAEAAVISMVVVSRGGSTGAVAPALWAGTEGGALHMWDVASGTALRVVPAATPSRSAVHHIQCTPRVDAQHVWVCTRGGSVALWDASRLMPLGELPVGYPRGPPISSRDAKLHHRSSTRNGVHFLRHLVTDTAEAPHHFTLFALPIEPVLTVRFWSAATDGTVRSWLCHTSLLGLPAGQLVSASRAAVTCPVSPGADGTAGLTAATATAAAAGTSGLSREAVGAFIAEKAAVFARETATLRGEVSQRTQEVAALQARNRVLADALKSAIARINQGEGTTNASPLPRPPTPVPVDVTDGAARIDAMRATLEELHGKLHDAYADKEQLLADRTAMQLRLSERASLSATTKVCRSASVPAESRHGLAAREGRGQMERLQEQLAMCQMECSMYVRHWRSEYMRRVAVVAEREACEERLATLQKELDHARAAIDFSSLPLQQRQQQLLQQQQPQSSFPTVTGDTQSGGDASDAAQTDAKLFWPTESMGLLVGVGVGEGDGDGNRSEANKDSVSDDDYDTGRALEGLAFYCGALSGGSAATPQGAGTAQTDLHEREQRLAAALRHLKDAWQRIKRTREVVETKAKRVRHAQKQLIAKEATLLEHAERLRALEEELRRKERRLMREGRGSQQGCCCCCSTCNLTTRCRCPKEEGGNAFAHICRATADYMWDSVVEKPTHTH